MSEKYLDVNEITYTDGRMYQKDVYSVPYEIRQFMMPETKEEGDFFYADLSNAELCLQAWAYGDEQLMADIHTGNFWDMWLSKYEGFTKADMKKCIFCMSYSGGTSTFPPATPRSFFFDFTKKYRVWWLEILSRKSQFESGKVVEYVNWVTGEKISLSFRGQHHDVFRFLNYVVQQSLSSYAQILFTEFTKRIQGTKIYCLNFDSVLVTNPKWLSKDEFSEDLKNVQRSLISEGVLKISIPFKCATGKTFAQAQGWVAE